MMIAHDKCGRCVWFMALAAVCFFGLLGCKERRVYQVKGVVQEIMDGGMQVKIAHEAIPGYMPAMTMPFDVRDPAETRDLKPGDVVQFQMIVTKEEGWIEKIKVTGHRPLPQPETAEGSIRTVPVRTPLNVGDLIEDYPMTNELGQAFTFSQFKGKALAFTFIFTRCTFPEFCQRMTSNFEAAARLLAGRSGAPTNWHLLSISFDTEFDTPSVLRNYARRNNANPAHWNFATTSAADMEALTDQFGLVYSKSTALFDHTLRTVVVDRNGRIQRIFTGNKWTPEELVTELIKAATTPNVGHTNKAQ